MKRLLLLAALCALAAAMVPRDRRAVNTEEEPRPTTVKQVQPICARLTPCGWAFYKPYSKVTVENIDNTYCRCAVGQSCQDDEDDNNGLTYIKRCKPIKEEPEETPTS